MSWAEFLQLFSASGRLSPATVRGYTRDLQLFLKFWKVERIEGPRQVQPRHLNEFYRHQLHSPQVSRATAGSRLRSLLVLLRWAVRQDILLVDPGQDLQVPKPSRPIQRVLTQEEVSRLLEAPNSARRGFIRLRDRALLELLYGTGIRAGEVLGLNVNDLDLPEQTLRILRGKGQNRLIPFGQAAAEALSAYLDWVLPRYSLSGETALFLNMHGERLEPKGLTDQLRRYGQKVGIPGVTAHTLRRSMATHLLQNGANIAEIKQLLGHADINSTMVYTQVFPVELMREHRRSHPRARRVKKEVRDEN